MRLLKRTCKKLIMFFLLISGLPFFIRNYYQKNRVTVVVYHDVSVSSFLRHVRYLKKYYNFITLYEFSAYLKGNKLPPYPLLFTFDDGHKNNYKLLPIFKDYLIRPVIFIVTGIIGTDSAYWFQLVNEEEKKYLKNIDNRKRIFYIKKNCENKKTKERKALSVKEIMEMKDYVDFASHTVTHPCLSRCTIQELIFELKESKKIILERFRENVFSLAYPNGDYSEEVLEKMSETGYSLGFTLVPGYNYFNTNPLLIKRFSISDDVPNSELILKSTGIWWILKNRITNFF